MKKYIFGLFMAAATLCVMNSCKEDEGQMPGNDKNPHVAIFQYDVDNNYDADCDVAIALYPNNKAAEVYYLAEPVDAKAQKVASMGEAGYADYVAKNGTKVSCTPENPAMIVLTNIFGAQAISAVGVNGSNVQAKAVEVQFTGLEWKTLATGTYSSKVNNSVLKSYLPKENIELQSLVGSTTRYRFKNLWGKNNHLEFTVTSDKDADGGFICRVPAQPTSLTYGSYGTLSVRDVATWQGSDDYLDCAIYPNEGYYAYFWVQYFVSAGNTGYGYDEFTPN